jgi:hypothetical protein
VTPVPESRAHRARASSSIEPRACEIGRDGGIRTHDPLTPSQVRYQAALHPESSGSRFHVPASPFEFDRSSSTFEFGPRATFLVRVQRARDTRFGDVLLRDAITLRALTDGLLRAGTTLRVAAGGGGVNS